MGATEAWQNLDAEVFGEEDTRVWDRFYSEFQFRPGEQPAIAEPIPSVTFSVSAGYGQDDETFRALISDLETKTCAAFRECTLPGQRMYALDWQHEGFWFYPHVPFSEGDPASWRIPVFPDGDYYIFLSEDFRFGTFGHPWEETICVFGQDLLNAFERNPPKLFGNVVRVDGRAV